MGENSCVVCGHREPDDGYVCAIDHQRTDTALAELPRQVARLALHMSTAGAATGPGERVSVSRTGSPTPGRLDVLDLAGPGSALAAAAMVGAAHPHVRRWRTVEAVQVAATGKEIEVTTWHQEISGEAAVWYSNSRELGPAAVRPREPGDPAPRRLQHDDQVGLVPPAPWAHGWVRRWQNALGHRRRPVRQLKSWDKTVDPYREELLADAAARTRALTTITGIGGYTAAADRPDDPLAGEWQHRFGPLERGYALDQDIDYLRSQLAVACESNLDIAVFTAQLRALAAELGRALGDRPDQQWLGRCPTMLRVRDTDTVRTCGGGLWQDPYASQVMCLRCRSAWGPGGGEILRLAVAIRKAWPVDRRRRYNRAEQEAAEASAALRCPGCGGLGGPVSVLWREVTARGDRERWWQPVKAVCRLGCDTGRLL